MKQEEAILACGCFWGAEDLLRALPGVISTEVGYTGGLIDNATYHDVKEGTTGHAESVKVVYDADQLGFDQILQFFFRMHDPTTMNRQGNDVGTQYRSAIFYTNDEQKRIAAEEIARVNASGKWKNPVVTQVVPARAFWRAEEYHQKYLIKNPGGYTCHWVRD